MKSSYVQNLSILFCALSVGLGHTPTLQGTPPGRGWSDTLHKYASEACTHAGRGFTYCKAHPHSTLLPLSFIGLGLGAWFAFYKYQEYRYNTRFKDDYNLPRYRQHKALKTAITQQFYALQKLPLCPSPKNPDLIITLYKKYRETFGYSNSKPVDMNDIRSFLTVSLGDIIGSCQDVHRHALSQCILLYDDANATTQEIYVNTP